MSLDVRSGRLEFRSEPGGRPEPEHDAAWRVPLPVDIRFLDGRHFRGGYDDIAESAGSYRGTVRLTHAGWAWAVRDTWRLAGPDHVYLERLITAERLADGREADGARDVSGAGAVAFHSCLAVAVGGPAGAQRPFVPASLYENSQFPATGVASFSDARLSYPLVAAYDQGQSRVLLIMRSQPASRDEGPRRERGQREFPQATDIGSMFVGRAPAGITLGADFPYFEGDRSAALDSLGSPARAYHPVNGDRAEFRLSYDIVTGPAADFSAAVRWSLGQVVRISPPRPATLPFSLAEAVGLRLRSAARTYVEWDGGGAGFRLNFDPERGYDQPARAFGASFTEHTMRGVLDILEYGFTGRQLNLAWALARDLGGDWLDRGRRVCDFFVRHLTTPSGFVYSHYDLAKRRPLFSVGDPDGPVLHYLARSGERGCYLRLMAEAGSDLLLNWELHARAGRDRPDWLGAARRLGDFLLRGQNPDGSWYRAYTPAGTGIHGGDWLGDDDEAKSSTAAAIPFLVALATAGRPRPSAGEPGILAGEPGTLAGGPGAPADRLAGPAGGPAAPGVGVTEGRRYLAAAERAGRFIMARHVAADRYRGGTLDNPNVVDKESALLTMSALLSLYRPTDDPTYLAAAERAARVGVSWTSLWDVPPVSGTPLGRAQVRSAGWGGINSIWGAGVTDIYSLFFLADLLDLAELTGDDLFASIAHLTAHGTAQLLSHPGQMFGFADAGMQPEGIAFCDQGVDDGLIAKGSIWGGLGWTYTAGIYGLGGYLARLARPDWPPRAARDRTGSVHALAKEP